MARRVAFAVLVVSACALPVFDAFEDDFRPVVVRQRTDPCAWDGGGIGVCYAVTAEAWHSTGCVGICGRAGTQPGIFPVGQCRLFCGGLDPCELHGSVDRDAGAVTGWIEDDGECRPVGGTSYQQRGVFEAKWECEHFCRCDTSKFEGGFSADCDVEFEVELGTVPPVPSFHIEGQRYLAEARGIRSMKEMCRIGRAPYVTKVRCVSPR